MLGNYEVFLIGCVGAIAPEILRLYRLRNTLVFNWSWGYIFISIIFVLLGGFVSYILEPSNRYAAFYTGISTPFIINAIAKETQQVSEDLHEIGDWTLDHNYDAYIDLSELEDLGEDEDEDDVATLIYSEQAANQEKQEEESLKTVADNNRKIGLKIFFRAL